MIEESAAIARKPLSLRYRLCSSCRPVYLLGILVVSLFSYALAEVNNIISFYNPETDISSFTSLKVSYDTYLSKRTVYRLQPFKDRTTFENLNENKQAPVMLISSWHYHLLDEKLKERIRPALIATQDGATTARKILTTKKTIKSLEDLRGAVIASAADREYTRELMFDLFHDFPPDLVDSIEVLSVPKEIDALMAVAYGVADGAITFERTLQKLGRINANQQSLLQVQAHSKEIMLPLLFVPVTQTAAESKLVQVLKDMPSSQEGRQQLRMIGFDGWKAVDNKIVNRLDGYGIK